MSLTSRARRSLWFACATLGLLVMSSTMPSSFAAPVVPLPVDCPSNAGALGNYGYTPNATDGTISVIDLRTEKVVDTFGDFRFPWNVLISEDGTKLYIDDSPLRQVLTSAAIVFDICARKEIKRIQTPGFEFGTTSPDEKTIWISNISAAGTKQIDANTGTVTKNFLTIPLTQGALSADNKTLWAISLPGLVTSFDMKTTLPNGLPIVVGALPAQFAITPDASMLATANLEGLLTMIDTRTREVVKTVNMGLTSYPSFAVFSPDSKQLWAGSYSGEVAVVDVASRTLVKTIDVGGWIGGVTFSNDGEKVYVTTTPGDSIVPQFGIGYLLPMLLDTWKPGGRVVVLDARGYDQTADIPVGNVPIALAIPGVY